MTDTDSTQCSYAHLSTCFAKDIFTQINNLYVCWNCIQICWKKCLIYFTCSKLVFILYFFQATGYGGAVKQGHDTSSVETMKPMKKRPILITFNADTAASMRWNFKPQQREVVVSAGSGGRCFMCKMTEMQKKKKKKKKRKKEKKRKKKEKKRVIFWMYTNRD